MIKLIIIICVVFCIVAATAIAVTHAIVFSRADYKGYDSKRMILYSDLDAQQYPREVLNIQSGDNLLAGYLYGSKNTKGLIVMSPGHRDPNDVKLYEITYFVDAGWMVLCFDYTGCYNSQGSSMVGYTQAVHDLDAVLDYVEKETRFVSLPVVLVGHSLGAYASSAVLQFGHNIKAVIAASGFDTPKEQWEYSIKRFTGVFDYILAPFVKLFIALKYGDEAGLSAVEGINSVTIPVLVISGTDDCFYGGESPIYRKRESITNTNCTYQYMTEEKHNGHYEYFLTDAALEYQKLVSDKAFTGAVDKALFMQHEKAFMNSLNSFLLSSIVAE